MSTPPSQTGAPPAPRAEDVPEALVDCHQRFRQVTALAAGLAGRPGATDEEVHEVAARVERYFTVALRLHEEDEEHSVFPRLLEAAPELAPAIAALRQHHRTQSAPVATLLSLCQQLQRGPERGDELLSALADAALAVDAAWQAHLASEEHDVFPAVRRALSPEARDAIRGEMRARRAHLSK